MTINELNRLIIEWAKERELDTKGTVEAQSIKTVEELSELIKAVCKDNREDIIDGVGDVYVTLVIGNMLKYEEDEFDPMSKKICKAGVNNKKSLLRALASRAATTMLEPYEEFTIVWTLGDLYSVCKFYDLDFTECVESAYNTIKNRHGVIKDGQYIKDEDLKNE